MNKYVQLSKKNKVNNQFWISETDYQFLKRLSVNRLSFHITNNDSHINITVNDIITIDYGCCVVFAIESCMLTDGDNCVLLVTLSCARMFTVALLVAIVCVLAGAWNWLTDPETPKVNL